MDILKQNVGIDISKDKFSVSLVVLMKNMQTKRLKYKEFDNTLEGIENFFSWSHTNKIEGFDLHYTMEATGVYYEELAYFLYDKKCAVHVMLPNRVKKFIDSFESKSKTDKIDSELIGIMGVERELPLFKPGSKKVRTMRKLTRERLHLIEEKTMIKNQLHAEKHSVDGLEVIITRMEERIKYIENQMKLVEKDLRELTKKDYRLSDKIDLLTSIPGIAFVTAATVIAETQGFTNISSIKQLSSYAGYDVQLRESGKYKGKTRISKQGNSHIRHCLYMPAIASISHSGSMRKKYDRINKNKASKLIGLTAIQRKLLGLMYTLWKNNTKYDENHMSKAA